MRGAERAETTSAVRGARGVHVSQGHHETSLTRRLALGGLVGLVAALGLAAPASAAGRGSTRPFTGSCGAVIGPDERGTLVLQNDIGPCASDGLVFMASRATLDLNGHSITGTPLVPDGPDDGLAPDGGFGEGVGIRVMGSRQATITNSRHADQTSTISDFDAGVVLQRNEQAKSRYVTVTNLRVFGNVGLQGAPPLFVGGNSCSDPSPDVPCEVSDFNDGIALVGAVNSTIGPNNTIEGNGSGGIRLDDAAYNTITANTIQDNLGNGVRFLALNHHNVVRENTIQRNAGGVNFSFENPDNTIEDNDMLQNRAFGVATAFHGERTVIRNNTIIGNLNGGITLGSGENLVTGNTLTNNGRGAGGTSRGNGIFVGSGTDNFPRVGTTVSGNTVTGSGGNGIRIGCMLDQDPINFAIYGCLVWDTHNQILNNVATGNAVNGPSGTQTIAGGQVTGWYDLLDSTNTFATQSPFDPSGQPLTNCGNNIWSGNTFTTAFPPCAAG